jgi:hypothetical protein
MRRSGLDATLPAVHSRLPGLLAWSVLVVSAGCAPSPELTEEASLDESASLEEAEQALSAFAVPGGNILFVGNSFTHGNEEPVYSYNENAVTDTNSTGVGGIPGIFKKMTTQAGFSFNVSVETASGQSLSYHYANEAATIGQPTWNFVVLQELSTGPLPTAKGGAPSDFMNAAHDLRALVLSTNPWAKLYLYETWASPFSVSGQGYPSGTPGLQAMQDDLRDA